MNGPSVTNRQKLRFPIHFNYYIDYMAAASSTATTNYHLPKSNSCHSMETWAGKQADGVLTNPPSYPSTNDDDVIFLNKTDKEKKRNELKNPENYKGKVSKDSKVNLLSLFPLAKDPIVEEQALIQRHRGSIRMSGILVRCGAKNKLELIPRQNKQQRTQATATTTTTTEQSRRNIKLKQFSMV